MVLDNNLWTAWVWKGIGPLSLGSLILCGEMCLGLIQIFLHNPFCEVSLAL